MSKLVKRYKDEVMTRASTSQIYFDISSSVLLCIDMINDACRKDFAFAKLGFDISHFKKIEHNISNLVNVAKESGLPVIYVTSFYDPEYIPTTMKIKFQEMGILNFPLARKGTWETKIVDTMPSINDYRLIKSHYSAFAGDFSLLYKENSIPEFENYLNEPASYDRELEQQGEKHLRIFI